MATGSKRQKIGGRSLRHVRRLLDETGLSWEIRQGTKHYMVYLMGHPIYTLSHGCQVHNDTKGLTSAIHRFKRDHGLTDASISR